MVGAWAGGRAAVLLNLHISNTGNLSNLNQIFKKQRKVAPSAAAMCCLALDSPVLDVTRAS